MRQQGVKSVVSALKFQKLTPSGCFLVNQRPCEVLTILLVYYYDIFREQFSNSSYFKALWSSDCLPSPEILSTYNLS